MQQLTLSPPPSLAAPPPLSVTSALFLDFDGTLAEIAPVPDAARLAPGMLEAVARAHACVSGRVALLSGRPISVLRQLVPVPGLAMAGVHGLERAHGDGRIEAPPPHPGLAEARNVLTSLAAEQPGLLIEDKHLSIGLHYRDAPWARAQATEVVSRLARAHGLEVQTGKMVVELRTPGPDKGDALIAFMGQPPFAGHMPVFIGDDDTDEAAFRAAAAHGGHGIRVGQPAGPTSAAYVLQDVAAVARWLGAA